MSGITIQKIVALQGKEVVLFRLQNSSDAYVELINYGATLVSVVVPDKYGNLQNVILRYDKIEDYFSDSFYLGSTVGRFANRISNARFDLNGTTFQLDKNDGKNTNHGGFLGFNKQIFDYQVCEDGVTFTLKSEDTEGGFPGNLTFSVSYSFNDNNELEIKYKALSDKDTIFNPTNHAYFNLSAKKENILNHELKVYAKEYLESTNEFLPTGNIFPVAGSAFDFTEYRKIRELMPLKKEILEGYNTYYIGENPANRLFVLLASLKDDQSGRVVDLYSDMPGFQLYTGDYLQVPFSPFEGVCLEAQFYPDAPNHTHFPSCVLYSGKETVYTIRYHFL